MTESKRFRLLDLYCGAGGAGQDRRDAMGIQWMTGKELSQAIPPAFTKFIGGWLMKEVIRQKES